MKNGDMPAMPLSIEQAENLYGFIHGNHGEPDGLGLTKREHFAGLALQGMCGDPDRKGEFSNYARDAVMMADALLAELEKSYE